MIPVFYEMKNAVIGIAGLGGLGSNVVVALARVGAGKLIIADFDVVEQGNLTRQHYFLDQIGQPKVQAAAHNLAGINDDTEVVAHRVRLTRDNIPGIFSEADVIAECFDLPEQKQMLVETVLTKMKRVIVVSASGLAGYGNSNAIRTRRISRRHILVGDGTSAAKAGKRLTASRVGVAAYHQANAIVEAIVDGA
ncbi:MAG TPA: sulfur carrier protein ThiS adenylyltransferase ThiF [Planctomycetes bacterium]|nr:sulfur carrier protein ThiS adenylyltransferase ThiF [Planctomycetota bacterium]HIJ70945.1 sulfur carrier protein ThiS adenylyltransferase ThiF [Planctomycetota bacterium]